jgi:hypothetical protein
LSAVFEAQLLKHATAAEQAPEAPDPWTGFCDYVEQLCAMQASDRGFADFSVMLLAGSEESQELRARALFWKGSGPNGRGRCPPHQPTLRPSAR